MKNPQQDQSAISFFNRFSGRDIFCKMPIFRTRSDCAWYPVTIGLSGRYLRGNTPSKYCDKKRSDSDKKCITKNIFLGGNGGK